jgi:hypothetical protein
MPPGLTRAAPGTGPGWERLAAALREALPAALVDGVWLFRERRRDPREYGTAILSRVDGDRRRIYTARYALMVKGRQRGAFEWGIEEVGSGPVEALEELLALVPERGVDDEPPAPLDPALWFPPPAAEPGDADPS